MPPDAEPDEGQQLDQQEFAQTSKTPQGLHPIHVRPPVVHMPDIDMIKLFQQAESQIALFGSGQDVENSPDTSFMSHAKSFLLDPSKFRAGNTRQHLPAWQHLFATFGTTHKAALVLGWIEHGVSFDFVAPRSEIQQSHPRFEERLQLVTDLLNHTVSAECVDACLDYDTPKQVHFANRVSCMYYNSFVREQRDELLASGALVAWDTVRVNKPQS
ncbi:TPA: hypothetical protein ACH3X2_002619 [Trebouxia sp. C0005]